jgi:tetratricopeptide (TPR) repeat protein
MLVRNTDHWMASMGLLMGAVVVVPAPLQAQPVVQQLPDPASERLNDALRRLSSNPQSLPALIEAGRASIELDDVEAAEGFLARAQAVSPDSGPVLAGLALVALRREDAALALELFDLAAQAGESLDPYAADHGLAYDLVGENLRAQERYLAALAREENAETSRRLALSYAISGNQNASETVLLPLLQRRDLAAYRTRAFALAILNQEDEAITIVETMLPARLASRLTPYMRYMPQLTPSQQAAAANLGRFPSVESIGRDEPRPARVVARSGVAQPSVDLGSRLVPEGEPLGPASSPRDDESALSRVLRQQQGPQDAAEPVEAAEQQSMDDAFAAFTFEDEESAADPRPGAVDLTTFEPQREVREPPPPQHPAREWVQVATGRDIAAFRFDWRRLVRNSQGLLDGREAYRARWNQTNRLLTGPFDSRDEAQQFVRQLSTAGISAFRFSSSAGEEVVPLD